MGLPLNPGLPAGFLLALNCCSKIDTGVPLMPIWLAAFDHRRAGKGYIGHDMQYKAGIIHIFQYVMLPLTI